MKLQAAMNRSVDKRGIDLIAIVRLTLDQATHPVALAQLSAVDATIAVISHCTSTCGSRASSTLQ
jgi:hypothetical protein